MWIGRRLDTSIYAVWSQRQPDDADHPRQEEVADNLPELLAYLAPKPPDPRVVTDQGELAAGKLDGTIMTLINQTRAEWGTWATANFPTLTAPERARMATICWILALAIRNHVR